MGDLVQHACRSVEESSYRWVGEPVNVVPAAGLDRDETAVEQAAQVIRGSRRAQADETRQLAGCHGSASQFPEDRES